MNKFRLMYTMYFNRKYSHRGRLGEKKHFTMMVEGYNHTIAAASYILRNPLHHGTAPIPYAYAHCSANAIFLKEVGESSEHKLLLPRRNHHRFWARAQITRIATK